MTLRELFYTLITIAKNGESDQQDIRWLKTKLRQWVQKFFPFA